MSGRKAGHRRRKREPGEDRTPKLPEVRCKALNKQGEPCRSNSTLANGYCVSHQVQAPNPIPLADGTLFGTPEQSRKSATGQGNTRRYPRLNELIEKTLEAKADEIIGAHLEGLIASECTSTPRAPSTSTRITTQGGEAPQPCSTGRWVGRGRPTRRRALRASL